jgi:hypothetical protein
MVWTTKKKTGKQYYVLTRPGLGRIEYQFFCDHGPVWSNDMDDAVRFRTIGWALRAIEEYGARRMKDEGNYPTTQTWGILKIEETLVTKQEVQHTEERIG